MPKLFENEYMNGFKAKCTGNFYNTSRKQHPLVLICDL